MDEAYRSFGSVDVLVNNAGSPWMESEFADLNSEHFERSWRIDVAGAAYCMMEALPYMRRNRWGRIINICADIEVMDHLLSQQYSHPLDKYPYDFVLAKRAKAALGEMLCLRELKYGVTINTVLPGIIEDLDNDNVIERVFGPGNPHSHWYDPIDVAAVVCTICSDSGRCLTGSSLRIPGNLYSRL